MPRVLVAPDKFKGSLGAGAVAAAVAAGVRRSRPDAHVTTVPVADGGEGTVEAAVAAGYDRVGATARGPTGAPIATFYARRGRTAVVELADACGSSRLPHGRPAPMSASTHGLGDVIRTALDAGCRRIVIGLGGSASTDGGAGMLSALGAALLDRDGDVLAACGLPLRGLADVRLDGLHPALAHADLVAACDVDNPLYGPDGAAVGYGPQKGATPAEVRELDHLLETWADLIARATGADHRRVPGAGAAGGTGFAAVAVLGAALAPGIDLILNLLEFEKSLATADLVITGEGSLDEQSLHGKAPVGVARAAQAFGVPVVAVCGRRSVADDDLTAHGISAVFALTDLEPDPALCMRGATQLLESTGARIARTYL